MSINPFNRLMNLEMQIIIQNMATYIKRCVETHLFGLVQHSSSSRKICSSTNHIIARDQDVRFLLPAKIIIDITPQRRPSSNRKSGRIPGKIQIWGLRGLGAISTVNLIERIIQKLRILILFHFNYFKESFQENLTSHRFYFFGPGGRDRDSQQQICPSLVTPRHSK